MKLRIAILAASVGFLVHAAAYEGLVHAARPAPTRSATAGPGSAAKGVTSKKKVELGPKGLKFALTSDSIAQIYDRVFTDEFVPRYRHVSSGPRMKELDQELEDRKAELRRRTEFGSIPMGLENSPIGSEFTYGNKESLTKVELTQLIGSEDSKQKREVRYVRHFFFFSDKMWKVYDEYAVGKKGLFGSFKQGIEKLNTQYGQKAQILKADPAVNRPYDTAQWTVGDTVVQLLDRTSEAKLPLVYADKSIVDKLEQMRPNKGDDGDSVSADVAEVTSKSTQKQPSPSAADAYTRKRR